jgi:hypothetical protein
MEKGQHVIKLKYNRIKDKPIKSQVYCRPFYELRFFCFLTIHHGVRIVLPSDHVSTRIVMKFTYNIWIHLAQ